MKRTTTYFGLPTGRQQIYPDITAKYPEDPYGEEASGNARVWRAYLDEAAVFDTEMIERWKDSTDVLLVFSGLFSAVVTTFVVQTAMKLEPDQAAQTAMLLAQIILAHQGNGGSSSSLPGDDDAFTAAPLDRAVNGLWFTSLAFSLATAFVAVLIKEWTRHYTSLASGTPQEQVRIRQYRYIGLELWHVPAIVGILPVLMHTALLLFFTGLVLFLVPLDVVTSSIVGVIGIVLYSAYFISNLLPLQFPQCPYRAQLSDYIFLVHRWSGSLYQRIRHLHTRTAFYQSCVPTPGSHFAPPVGTASSAQPTSLKGMQAQEVELHSEELDVLALSWLYSTSSNPITMNLVLQSTAGLDIRSEIARTCLENANLGDAISAAFHSCFTEGPHSTIALLPGAHGIAERLARSLLQGGDILPWAERQRFNCLITAGEADSHQELIAVGHCFVCLTDTRRQFRLCDRAQSLPDVLNRLLQPPYRLHPVVWRRLMQTASKSARLDQHPVEWSLGVKLLGSLRIGKDAPTKTEETATSIAADARQAHYLIDYLHSTFCTRCSQEDKAASSQVVAKGSINCHKVSMINLLHTEVEMVRYYGRMKAHGSGDVLVEVYRQIGLLLAPEVTLDPGTESNVVHSRSSPNGSPTTTSDLDTQLSHAVQIMQYCLRDLLETEDWFFHPLMTDKNRRATLILLDRIFVESLSISCWWMPDPILLRFPPPPCTEKLMAQMVRLMQLETAERLVSDALFMKRTVLATWDRWLEISRTGPTTEFAGIYGLFKQTDALHVLTPVEARVESHRPRNTVPSKVIAHYLFAIVRSEAEPTSILARDFHMEHMDYIHLPQSLSIACGHFTLHQSSNVDQDSSQLVSMGSMTADDSQAILALARQARNTVYGGVYDDVWKDTIRSLVGMTRRHDFFHYSNRDTIQDLSRTRWTHLHGYYRAYGIIDKLRKIWELDCDDDDYALVEYCNGLDLEKLPASSRLLDGLPVHGPLVIPYESKQPLEASGPSSLDSKPSYQKPTLAQDEEPIAEKSKRKGGISSLSAAFGRLSRGSRLRQGVDDEV